jgi:hypothetical protein
MSDDPNKGTAGTAATNVTPTLPSPTNIATPSPTVASNSGLSHAQLKADAAKLNMSQGTRGGK